MNVTVDRRGTWAEMENAAVEGAATTGRRPLQGRPQTPLIGHAELSLPALRLAVARDDGTTCGAGNGEQGSAIGSGGYLEVSMRVPWCDERRSSLLRLPPRPLTTNSLSDRDTPTAKPRTHVRSVRRVSARRVPSRRSIWPYADAFSSPSPSALAAVGPSVLIQRTAEGVPQSCGTPPAVPLPYPTTSFMCVDVRLRQ